MMRILVTGASGFIGRYLVPALLRGGHDLVLPLRSSVDFFNRSLGGLEGRAKIHLIDDLKNANYNNLTSGVDSVIHLAGIAHTRARQFEENYKYLNHQVAVDLAKAAERNGVKRFIFMSSIKVQSGLYGDHIITEVDVPMPLDAYGQSKLAAEIDLAKLSELPCVSFRPVVVYGPNARGSVGLLQKCIKWGVPLPIGSIKAKRSYVSIERLVSAIDFALKAKTPLRGSYIVADPDPLSLTEFVHVLQQQMQTMHSDREKLINSKDLKILSINENFIKVILQCVWPDLWRRCGEKQIVSAQALRLAGWQDGA